MYNCSYIDNNYNVIYNQNNFIIALIQISKLIDFFRERVAGENPWIES
jgi:hypothetical protein